MANARNRQGRLDLLRRGLADVIEGAVGRHLPLALVAGFIAAANHASPLAPYTGMLIGTAISLLMDEEADQALKSRLDRVDVAALAAGGAWVLHAAGRVSGFV